MCIKIRLSEMEPDSQGRISEIIMEEKKERRLLDLGFTEGTKITCIGESFFGSQKAYRIRGAVIALRTSDAGKIYVEMEEKE